MEVAFSNRFSKQLNTIKDDSLLKRISKTVKNVMSAKTMHEIRHLKKIKGHPSAYRIRVGNYRIGLFIEETTVLFAVFEHRKDIYNQFP